MFGDTSVDRIGNFLDTIFLLFLGTVGGMVGGAVLNCGVQKVVTDSKYLKHLIFFIIIMFTNSFIKSSDAYPHPAESLLRSVIIYLAFMLMMKCEKMPLLVILILCSIVFVLRDYQKYLTEKIEESEDKSDMEKLEMVNKSMMWILSVAAVVLVVGAYMYLKRQMDERGDKFEYSKYFFGSNQCDSLKGGRKR